MKRLIPVVLLEVLENWLSDALLKSSEHILTVLLLLVRRSTIFLTECIASPTLPMKNLP